MTDYLGVDMSKSSKGQDPDLLTVEEAASILGVGQKEVQIRFGNGSLTKRRASNGEVRVSKAEVAALAERLKPVASVPGEPTEEYARRVVAGWPAPSESQRKRLSYLLFGGTEPAPAGPSDYELEQRKKGYEREEALRKARKAAEALTACDVCNLQPEAHRIRQANSVDMHEWQAGRAEKLMKLGAGA